MRQIQTKKEMLGNNLKPIKHVGQHFLVSEEIISKIISRAKIKKGETILEVGPGTGNLTEALLSAGANVIAVEKDKNLSELLNSKFHESRNLFFSPHMSFPPASPKLQRGERTRESRTFIKDWIPGSSPRMTERENSTAQDKFQIINRDILKFNEESIPAYYRIIANIPYYLTGKLLQKFLRSPNKPSEMILMVQKEVGERITAKPPKMNYLSAFVQTFGEAEILFSVGKENFWPKPKVDSVVVKITLFQDEPRMLEHSRDTVRAKGECKKLYGCQTDEFVEFLKMVFKQPRKTLFNNLRNGNIKNADDAFAGLGLHKNIRGQDLSLKQLMEIFERAK